MFLDSLDAGVTFCFFQKCQNCGQDSQVYDSVLVKWKVMLSTLHYSLCIQQEIRKTHHYRVDLHMCAQMSTWTHKSLVLVLYLITI